MYVYSRTFNVYAESFADKKQFVNTLHTNHNQLVRVLLVTFSTVFCAVHP